MKKFISILVVSFMVFCVGGNSYAGNNNENTSVAIAEGGKAEAVASPINTNEAQGGEAKAKSNSQANAEALAGSSSSSGAMALGNQEVGGQNVEISKEEKVYSSVLNVATQQGKDEAGINTPFGGLIDSNPSVDAKLEKKGIVVGGYEDRGLLGGNKDQGKIEAARDMQAFNSDLRIKTGRATLGVLPGTGNRIVDSLLGTKSVWPTSNSQAKAVKSLKKINNLASEILEMEFKLEDVSKEAKIAQLNKKIAGKKKSLKKEERRFKLYNEQSKRVIDIR